MQESSQIKMNLFQMSTSYPAPRIALFVCPSGTKFQLHHRYMNAPGPLNCGITPVSLVDRFRLGGQVWFGMDNSNQTKEAVDGEEGEKVECSQL